MVPVRGQLRRVANSAQKFAKAISRKKKRGMMEEGMMRKEVWAQRGDRVWRGKLSAAAKVPQN